MEIKEIQKLCSEGKIRMTGYAGPACLMLGYTFKFEALHVVVGIKNDILWIITAYYPSDEKWEKDYRHRKEQK